MSGYKSHDDYGWGTKVSYDKNIVNQEWISVRDKHLNRHAVGMKNKCSVFY